MRRIGIYGGAFNPPHFGHLRAAEAAKEGLSLDLLVVVPTGMSPHKLLPAGSPSPAERLRMAELAFAGMEHVTLSDVELRREGPSYTADTLLELHDQYPDDEIWLITGSDMFLSIHTWRYPEEILSLCRICALSRKDGDGEALERQAEFLMERYGAVSVILENDVVDISSTEIREALLRGEGGAYLPAEVLAYIRSRGLYHG